MIVGYLVDLVDGTTRVIIEEPDWDAATARVRDLMGGQLPNPRAVASNSSEAEWLRNEKHLVYASGSTEVHLLGPHPK